jgi:mannose-6-phosphate isomerase-like protein (cupin superfamily)
MSLDRTELRAFAARLSGEFERWAHALDAVEPGERVYELIWDDEDVNAWVIIWNEDSDTGFHDHDDSAAAISVIAGTVREDRLSLGGLPRVRLFGGGDTFTVAASAIHRVLHAGSGPAVTIHAYSPPLRRMGTYRATDDGVLERESRSFEVELRAPALA